MGVVRSVGGADGLRGWTDYKAARFAVEWEFGHWPSLVRRPYARVDAAVCLKRRFHSPISRILDLRPGCI